MSQEEGSRQQAAGSSSHCLVPTATAYFLIHPSSSSGKLTIKRKKVYYYCDFQIVSFPGRTNFRNAQPFGRKPIFAVALRFGDFARKESRTQNTKR
jgi:hypothetical protein